MRTHACAHIRANVWFCPCGGQSVCLPAYLRTVHHNQMDKLVQVSLASSTLSQAQLWGWFSENTANEISLSLPLPGIGAGQGSRATGPRMLLAGKGA